MSDSVARLELTNGVVWTRRFGPEDEEWTRESRHGSIDMDFTAHVVEMFLNDTGLFTPGEACLLTWNSNRRFAEMVADVLEKRPATKEGEE